MQMTALLRSLTADVALEDSRHGPDQKGSVDVLFGHHLQDCRHWKHAFATQHKDHRYYEIVADTLHPEFRYLYFALRDAQGQICAIQPFFILDQDILAGAGPYIGHFLTLVRRQWPRFFLMRTMMVGCVAGDAQLDDGSEATQLIYAQLLAGAITKHARAFGTGLIVLKEFPDNYRDVLSCFLQSGFARVPSMPLTILNIRYSSFDEYMRKALNSATRSKLRRKFKATIGVPIELTVCSDVTLIVDEIYPLYLQVYHRSKLHFEKLTKEYFCRLGKLMPDRVRFFVWRHNGKAVAFGECIVHGETMFAEYLGLDYSVALRLHLYHYVFRDLVTWGIANGYKSFQSSGLNYDPKLHLRHRLKPVDLYVRHTSSVINLGLRMALPWLEPTRYDKTLKKFPNYRDLWETVTV
ncbi:MAG TPA: GNAT family N-acetyltransferase [Xanthobacteraceae bacterium]|nr:GNAT family N-acetyltransferase [Xanthobacteraceae bacterium]